VTPEVLIATGGDDQALGVILLSLDSTKSDQKIVATVKGSVMLANAHSSAIKVIMFSPNCAALSVHQPHMLGMILSARRIAKHVLSKDGTEASSL